jgi:hypothetical protein
LFASQKIQISKSKSKTASPAENLFLNLMKLKKKILCFADYYLQGYKAGGPIQSIANLVENLSDEFEFPMILNFAAS